ncbi:uncharacterized protein LOC115598247 isoform X2 [Calypte anna]|uniref:uncharacterized protein LOC115598247 isoform X2 n=1 Tax=Calypte anna TaxID=9244 RepID=UPI0011C3E45D|nr:uncharacterized protein LOC115598247 isoform X2 [Calypte anna]
MADERGRGAGLPDYTLFPGPGGASPGSGASSPECPRPAGGSPPHLRAEPWPLQSQVAAAPGAGPTRSRRSWERRGRSSSAGWCPCPPALDGRAEPP